MKKSIETWFKIWVMRANAFGGLWKYIKLRYFTVTSVVMMVGSVEEVVTFSNASDCPGEVGEYVVKLGNKIIKGEVSQCYVTHSNQLYKSIIRKWISKQYTGWHTVVIEWYDQAEAVESRESEIKSILNLD